MTNYEKIKGMGMDEMANIIDLLLNVEDCFNFPGGTCAECMLNEFCRLKTGDARKWLESEAGNEEQNHRQEMPQPPKGE